MEDWSGMAGVSLPVTRPAGRALVVAHPTGRAQPVEAMNAIGFDCAAVDDPYTAMSEIAARPMVYRALVLGLAGMYREELELIRAVKRRFPHVEVWLTQTDGRHSALAEAMRLGADGLLAEDGLHRTALGAPDYAAPAAVVNESPAADGTQEEFEPEESKSLEPIAREEPASCEPVLSAEELRALLEEQPVFPPDRRDA